MDNEKLLNFDINYKNIEVYKEYSADNINFPLVLSVPHSGQFMPDKFVKNTSLPSNELLSSCDCFVDDMLMPLTEIGIPMISMNVARVFIDANRDKIELDPAMYYNYPQTTTNMGRKCRVGLGVIHRISGNNQPIYDGLLDFDEVNERIKNVYDVYHKRLKYLVDKTTKKFGFCLLVDCHSMPSKIFKNMPDQKEIEFCLGTLFEQSCPPEMYSFLYNQFEDMGYNTAFNCPYSGAFITFNYCQPRKQMYSIQLEINRKLYSNEESQTKNEHFQNISENTCNAIENLAHFLLDFKK